MMISFGSLKYIRQSHNRKAFAVVYTTGFCDSGFFNNNEMQILAHLALLVFVKQAYVIGQLSRILRTSYRFSLNKAKRNFIRRTEFAIRPGDVQASPSTEHVREAC